MDTLYDDIYYEISKYMSVIDLKQLMLVNNFYNNKFKRFLYRRTYICQENVNDRNKKFIKNMTRVDKLDDLPKELLSIRLYFLYNRPINHLVTQQFLQKITFGPYFDQIIDKQIKMTNLRKLKFGLSYNQPVNNLILPPTLKKLTFGKNFNQFVNNLIFPPSLSQLIFGHNFNQPLNFLTLPTGLQKLYIGHLKTRYMRRFDKLILPTTLKEICPGCYYWISLDHQLDSLVIPINCKSTHSKKDVTYQKRGNFP